MIFKSVHFKIMLWYMLVLALTLTLFSVSLYYIFNHSLYENLDDLLLSKAEGVANSIDGYWETEMLEAAGGKINTDILSKINNINFIKIAQHWVEEKSNDPKLIDIIVQIFDGDGRFIASSKNMPGEIALKKEIFDYVSKGQNHFYNFSIEFSQGKPLPVRMLTIPVIENDKLVYIVQVASPLNTIGLALTRLRAILFLVLPLTVLSTGIVGSFLAKVTLNPVDSMIKTIRQIKADNLKLRIDIPDTKDEIRSLADTFNDMLEELDRSFSSQRQFIQDISHELKTPLTILKGEMEVALKKIRSQGEYESIMRSNLEEINKISRIIDNLLLLARFDSKQVSLEINKVELDDMIKGVLNNISVLAQQKKLAMSFSCPEKVVLEGDENQLRRVLLNLLDNAIKYTQSGSIAVKLEKKDDTAIVDISDTGAGIPEDEIPHIFDRFYRVDKSRSSAGFGLGLSISKSIVEAHRGAIEVKSLIDHGTTFRIILPLSCRL